MTKNGPIGGFVNHCEGEVTIKKSEGLNSLHDFICIDGETLILDQTLCPIQVRDKRPVRSENMLVYTFNCRVYRLHE